MRSMFCAFSVKKNDLIALFQGYCCTPEELSPSDIPQLVIPL